MRILCVGVATVDEILVVEHFPVEDGKYRASGKIKRRGGNAGNSCVVLSQLGHACGFAGACARDDESRFIENDFARHHVQALCEYHAHRHTPQSTIIASRGNASRTIIHYRDLPELSFDFFQTLPLSGYDWLHFEGRDCAEVERMLRHARRTAPATRCSLEVEKKREGIEALMEHATHILFGRPYAQAAGFNATQLLMYWHRVYPGAFLACAWGAEGAYGLYPDSATVLHQPAMAKAPIVDTTGAGDTFNAGMIHSWIQGASLQNALQFSQTLAAKKIAQWGFDAIV